MDKPTRRPLPPEVWTCVLRSLTCSADLLAFTLTSKTNRELVFVQPVFSKRLSVIHSKVGPQLTGALRTLKRHSPNLKSLDLTSSALDVKQLANIFATFNQLQDIGLASIRWRKPFDIQAVTFPGTLRQLDLSFARISDADLEHILSSTTALRRLSLSHCMVITGSSFELLPASIQSCDFSHMWNLQGDNITKYLANKTSLTRLELVNCKKITNEHLQELPENLQYLDLSDITRISDDGLQKLPPRLSALFLRRCYSVTSRVCEVTTNSLMRLNLDYCKVDSLTGISTRLHSLDLSYCWRIYDDALSILSSLESLHRVNLTGCENITNDSVAYLPPSVTWLSLKECYRISDQGLVFLPKNVEYLDLSYCWEISNDGLSSHLPERLDTLVVCRYLEDESNPESMGHLNRNLTLEDLEVLGKERGFNVIINQALALAEQSKASAFS